MDDLLNIALEALMNIAVMTDPDAEGLTSRAKVHETAKQALADIARQMLDGPDKEASK